MPRHLYFVFMQCSLDLHNRLFFNVDDKKRGGRGCYSNAGIIWCKHHFSKKIFAKEKKLKKVFCELKSREPEIRNSKIRKTKNQKAGFLSYTWLCVCKSEKFEYISVCMML